MKPKQIDWARQIEEKTSASDHLAFAKQISQRFDLGKAYHQQTLATISAVQQRLEDPNLYIAIVGRASTGKSTFVNALLGDAVLKAHVLTMTTAISTKVVYGEELAIHVRFKEEAADLAFSKWGLGLSGGQREGETEWRVRSSEGAVSFKGETIGIHDLIASLTTSDAVAAYLDTITITYPSDFLKPGIVLIDTPGADATNDKHKQITREAVAKADTAIIITPGEQPISGWLSDALADPGFLRPFLHRCVFVLTRMDVALKRMRRTNRDEAISLIYEDAAQRLAANLSSIKIKTQPRFYISSAQCVLEPFTGDAAEDDTIRYWQEEFERLKTELHSVMVRQRAATIFENTLRLIEGLLRHMETHLSELWEDYNQRKEQLEKAVHDLDAFCTEKKKHWQEQVANLWKNNEWAITAALDKLRDKTLSSIRQDIYNADTISELKAVPDDIEGRIKTAFKSAESTLKTQARNINSEASAFIKEFERQFALLYDRLSLLDNTVSASSGHVKSRINSREVAEWVGNKLQNSLSVPILDDISNFLDEISPGLGKDVADFLFSFFGPPLEERKRRLWNNAESETWQAFNELRDEMVESTETYIQDLGIQVTRHVILYENEYGSVVKKMRTDQARERSSLQQEQAAIEAALQGLRQRRLAIKEQQEDLRLTRY